MQGVIVFLLSLLVGFRPLNWYSLPFTLLFMFMIAVLFTALGTALASFMEDMHGFQLITNFLIMPIFFLSGSLFPLKDVPSAILAISNLDPLSYGIDGIRTTLIDSTHFGLSMDLVVLSVLIVLTLSIGGYMFSKIQI
jgi:ABC-2 type transport system permease protein